MSLRQRSSVATPARRRHDQGQTEEPETPRSLQYQPLSHPLTAKAQQALESLLRQHDFSALNKRVADVNDKISNIAAEVTEKVVLKNDVHKARREKRLAKGMELDEDADREMEELLERGNTWSAELECAVRKNIDIQQAITDMVESVREMAEHPEDFQQGASNRRRRQSIDSESDENATLLSRLRQRIQENQNKWDSTSMYYRYAENNDYIQFARMMHEAKYSQESAAPPLPNPTEWFAEADRAAGHGRGGRNTRQNAATGQDDDDIILASENKSIKCPITLLEFKDPVTSTQCPHSFEKAAIMEMIKQSTLRESGKKAVRCPECDKTLTASDLKPDPALLRRVKRIQALEAQQEADDDDEDDFDEDEGSSPAVTRESHARHRTAAAAPQVKAERVKAEIASRMSLVPETQVSGTQVVDLEGSEEE
ncbi:MAG: hypothetical protein M1834_002638 [Cirrosporium novae-zelandiae]|nr:MAG: hypothetical protein M1834_002638 [Cirrosporium novae-zelandiae]